MRMTEMPPTHQPPPRYVLVLLWLAFCALDGANWIADKALHLSLRAHLLTSSGRRFIKRIVK